MTTGLIPSFPDVNRCPFLRLSFLQALDARREVFGSVPEGAACSLVPDVFRTWRPLVKLSLADCRFNVSFGAMGGVTTQCPQLRTFQEKEEPKRETETGYG